MMEFDARADGPGLEEWITTNGPLWPPAAFALALGISACLSRLPDAEPGKVIASLNTANIRRGEHGEWSWVPVRLESSGPRVPEREVIERLGAILFHCLTAQTLPYPFPGEQALRARIRSLRPDLPPTAVDMILDALTALDGKPVTLTIGG